MITVASALHWLDIHAFYNECRKALKPGGIFAAWAYNLFKFPNNPRANDAMKVPILKHTPSHGYFLGAVC